MGDLPPGFTPTRIDQLFGQIAVARHFVSHEHVREGLVELARRAEKDPDLRLADILVRHGHLTRSQRETVEQLAEKQLGPEQVGRYELIKKIGEGGMGSVYKAKDVSPDGKTERVVALKVLPPELAKDETFMGRFQREALALTRMEHPNIVRGLDVGSAGGAQYIAMEFIDGIDCDKMLTRRGRIPEKEALRIAVQMASALHYAHEQRLVHRDIKPANILVAQDGTAKLTDLGLAKSTSATASKLTQTGITMGTPHYISPEQAMGSRDLDVRSDVYSLGATLYHLVTGRVPFEGSSPAVIVAKHLTEELVNPKDLVPEISDGLVRILEKMMAKDRDERYQDPGMLVADFNRVLEDKAPELEEMAAGKSAIMKAAEFREAAARFRAKRRRGLGARRSVTLVVLGAALALGVVAVVLVLVLRSKHLLRGDIYGDGWEPLMNGAGGASGSELPGWVARGKGAVAFDAGEYIVTGPMVLESEREFRDYRLRMDIAASEGAQVRLVVNRPAGLDRGGCSVRLPARGVKKWSSIDATVKGAVVTVLADGEEFLDPEAARPSEKGVVSLEFGDGVFRLRALRYRPMRSTEEGRAP
jgi:serine/threonine-protein kinase